MLYDCKFRFQVVGGSVGVLLPPSDAKGFQTPDLEEEWIAASRHVELVIALMNAYPT